MDHRPAPPALRLLAVGDPHGEFGATDREIIAARAPDLVLCTGDLGDEDPAIIRELMALEAELAVILGNHDGGTSLARGAPTAALKACLDLLGPRHVGFRAVRIGHGFAVLGARPYSMGGPLETLPRLVQSLYGLRTPAEAAERMVAAAREVPDARLIVLAHNGPAGLGGDRAAPFGRDFKSPSIDFGDPDLALALDALAAEGREVDLVIAGHMHDRLRGGGERRRVGTYGRTLVVNAAVVPRYGTIRGMSACHMVEAVLTANRPPCLHDLWLGPDGSVLSARRLWP